MKKRSVGTTEVELSEVALGTWGLASDAYGRADRKRFGEVVSKAHELEVTTFDLAPLWGDGAAEEVVGEALAEVIKERRDEVQLITRAGARFVDGKLDLDSSADALRKDFEGSLERLGTDRLDVWLLHEPKEELWDREDWRELIDELKKDEKIGAWGATVSSVESAKKALEAEPDVICFTYNIVVPELMMELSADIAKASCSVLARSPLMHGMLAGRWAEYRSFPRTDHRRDRWASPALRARIRKVNSLRFLVHDDVASLAEASLRYVLANSLVCATTVGARTPAQIEAATKASVAEPPYLPDADLTKIPVVMAKGTV